jgi:hypothetical protein
MAEEQGSTGRWLRRITDTLSGEPRDIEDLLQTLTQARERGLINSDAFEMLEGVLRVAELQVRDIMVPRSQMTIVNRDDPRTATRSSASCSRKTCCVTSPKAAATTSTSRKCCVRSCSFPRASASTCCSRNSAPAIITWRWSSTSTAA